MCVGVSVEGFGEVGVCVCVTVSVGVGVGGGGSVGNWVEVGVEELVGVGAEIPPTGVCISICISAAANARL